MRILLLLVVLLVSSVCQATAFDPFAGSIPVAVLIESNPWAMVMGSDTPRVAVYKDGEIIYVDVEDGQPVYRHGRLSADVMRDLQRRLSSLARDSSLKANYELTRVTDQPTTSIYWMANGRAVGTNIYGLEAVSMAAPGERTPPDSHLPSPLLRFHAWLSKLRPAQSEPWVPKYLEVMLWDYSYAPEQSIRWPNSWPSLSSPRALRRGDQYSVFLDGGQFDELRQLLSSRNPKGALLVDGKKWAVSYRHVFPGEPAWRKTLFGGR